MCKIKILFLLVVFESSLCLAQTDYEKWLQQENQKFGQFIEEQDKAFAKFLEHKWKEINLADGVVLDLKPKPVKIPKAENITPIRTKPLATEIIPDIPMPELVPSKPPKMDIDLPEINHKKERVYQFDFFGVPVNLIVDKGFSKRFRGKLESKQIGKYWKRTGKNNHKKLLSQLQALKQNMALNDWGYGMLLESLAGEIFPASKIDRNLFLWYVLSKSGYDARVGYDKENVYLLMPSNYALYSTKFFIIDDIRYYIVSFDGAKTQVSTLYTYKKGKYKRDSRALDLGIKVLPILRAQIQTKDFEFNYQDDSYQLSLDYNETLVTFFQTYPQTELSVYFAAPLSNHAKRSVFTALKPILAGKTEVAAVNILLRFVQIGFEYQTDNEQFQQEKFLFAEETIFYPFSDCEDRAVLFATLVRELIGLHVIGLDYPGHVATAVNFQSEVEGSFVYHANKKYTICDPTFLNANLGKPIPQVQGEEPQIVSFEYSGSKDGLSMNF